MAGKTTVLNFGTIGEYNALKASPANADILKSSFDENGGKPSSCKSWFGTSTMAEAEKILNVGWPEGVKQMKDTIGQVQVPGDVKCVRKRMKYATTGEEVDYEKMMSGDPLCYKVYVYDEGYTTPADKHIRIAIDMVASGWTRPDQMFWKGAAAASLADALEASGRSVEIVGYFFSQGFSNVRPHDRIFVNVVLKKEGEPMDLSRIVGLTGHAASLRILGFKAIASDVDRISTSFGSVVRYEDATSGKMWPDIPGAEGVPTVHVHNIWSKEAAMNFLADRAKAMDAAGKPIEFQAEPAPPKIDGDMGYQETGDDDEDESDIDQESSKESSDQPPDFL